MLFKLKWLYWKLFMNKRNYPNVKCAICPKRKYCFIRLVASEIEGGE